MYLAHFGLTHYPFERELQPDELFASTALSEATARLNHLVELRGIGLITGEVGSGKTTACRQLAASLHAGLYRLFYVTLSTGNVMDMYKSIAFELGLPIERSRATAFRSIQTEITRLASEARQHPVLVVDEAHHLRNEVLEDLRLLTNYAMDAERRLCMLLVGLTELRRRLAMAVHESLEQRIVVRYHLSGFARDELPAYLIHRVQLAGCTLPLFEPAAIEALFQAFPGTAPQAQPCRPLRALRRRARQGPPGQHRTCSNCPGRIPSVSACGLWQGTRRLSAVIVDDDGTLRSPITTPATPDNATHLLAYLATIGIDVLILAERTHTLITQAHALGLHVRIVPHDLLEAIRAATGLTQRPPRDTACLLARWYQTPALRLHLRTFHQPTAAKQQLALF